jgi:hypothetical protein
MRNNHERKERASHFLICFTHYEVRIPTKIEPVFGDAVRVTVVAGKFAKQVPPRSMPAGILVIVPSAFPPF